MEDKVQYSKKYYEEHKEYFKEYYKKNKENWNEGHTEYMILYRKTPIGRANMLLQRYKRRDKEKGRGEGDLTSRWIVENIFTKPCVHCGETDWHKLGCNRIDNSKPHTKDNVEPCCKKCNIYLK